MHRISTIVCLSLFVLRLAAQVPDWYNAASRKMHYPPEAYYTGFAEGVPQKGESTEAAVARLKDVARVELVSTIRTTVEQTIQSRSQSELRQSTGFFDERISESFVSETRISSGIKDIPGLKVEAYLDPKSDGIAAFAYVKRQSLVSHLVKRIALLAGKAENDWQQAAELADSGYKFKARAAIEKGMQHLSEAEEAQSLLAAIDETADEESLQTEQTRTLFRQLTALDNGLQNAVAVFLQCEAQLFDGTYTLLKGAIEGALSETGVSFVAEPDEADWAIYVHAEAQEHAKTDFGSVSNYAALVEVHMDIDRMSSAKRVYSNSIASGVTNHTRGFEQAAREAYKKLTPLIIDIINENISY